jgi:hypothetical protein
MMMMMTMMKQLPTVPTSTTSRTSRTTKADKQKSGNQPAVLPPLSAIALVWKSGFQISLKKKT